MTTVTLTLKSVLDKTAAIRLPNWPAKQTHVPGLIVCRVPTVASPTDKVTYRADNGELFTAQRQDGNPQRYFYQIIHEASGIAVLSLLYSEYLALTVANKLGSVDWAVPKEQISKAHKECVEAVWKEVTGEKCYA